MSQALHYSGQIDIFQGLVISTPILLSVRILITFLRKRLTVITNMRMPQEDIEFLVMPGPSRLLRVSARDVAMHVTRSDPLPCR